MERELPVEDLIRVHAPTCLYRSDGTILPPDPVRAAEPQFAYRAGLTTLAKLLFQSLPAERASLRRETRIASLQETEEGIVLRDDQGGIVGRATQVVITAPAAQSADLLAASRLRETTTARQDALRSVPYSACLCVMLAYAPPMPEPPCYALLAEDRNDPLLWLAFENVKLPSCAPDGETLLIAQMGPAFSAEYYSADDSEITALALAEIQRLFGATYPAPLWSEVKRWRYAQPRGMVAFEAVNPTASPVVVCGDALRPENGRVHQAYSSGLEAAQRLLESQ
jgi:predicted NAD/FAD-dependent oxidoreductase